MASGHADRQHPIRLDLNQVTEERPLARAQHLAEHPVMGQNKIAPPNLGDWHGTPPCSNPCVRMEAESWRRDNAGNVPFLELFLHDSALSVSETRVVERNSLFHALCETCPYRGGLFLGRGKGTGHFPQMFEALLSEFVFHL